MSYTDRFDLEEALMSCWGTADDIKLVSEMVVDEGSSEEIANALIGIRQLHEMKCKRAFAIFERMLKEGVIDSGHKTGQDDYLVDPFSPTPFEILGEEMNVKPKKKRPKKRSKSKKIDN